MIAQLLQFILAFIAVMLSGPLIVLLWVFAAKTDIFRLLAEHGMLCSLMLGCYGIFVSCMFFALQDHFMVFRPPAEAAAPLSKPDLMALIEKAFSRPVEGQQLFEVVRQGDKLIVTWHAAIDYFQLTSGGGRGMKRVIVLTFDEKRHQAYFVMKERDSRWRASLHGAEYSLNFSTGFVAEFRTEAYPSIDFSPQEGLRVEVKKLSYNSEELFQPLCRAVLGAGWSLHGGMIQGLGHRILFSIPVGLLFVAFGAFFSFVASHDVKYAATAPAQPLSQAAGMPESSAMERQLGQIIPSIKTEMLEAQIQGIIRTPPQYLQEYARRALVIYLNAYMRREDRRESVLKEALAFAGQLKLSGVDVPAGTH